MISLSGSAIASGDAVGAAFMGGFLAGRDAAPTGAAISASAAQADKVRKIVDMATP
ncbi:hypothetical protein GCM10011617_19690 [Novosphingobium arvoryzae]|uniref:Uncharacterized protein n=1 Tax=Novosphingobium arvoryzae TaxID=1256514 RepID=A0A918RIG2_9SPHN|nr:hypothetical protein GCM10011617_19690 [Novosphingobium arvoryzae]